MTRSKPALPPSNKTKSPETVTIRVRKTTRDRIIDYGQFTETFDNVLTRILDEYAKLKKGSSRKV